VFRVEVQQVRGQELELRLRPFISRRVPPSDLDDVMREVYLRIQKSLPSLRDEERLSHP
jgi:RNA polymerase sigma-70 factor (ECF subfamily)